MLNFGKSLSKTLQAKEKAEQHRISDILHPDTSNRLRFASMGDPPRPKPQRGQFGSDKKFQAALSHWGQEQVAEKAVYEKALR